VPLELKNTLNLPKTGFPMKANLPQNEPKILERWERMKIYDRIREERAGAGVWLLHDGPPYANGPIHLGHALNKCLKDFIVKSKTMAGLDSPYVPGWDCHGLPIEIKVDQQLGGKKLQMRPIDVRNACRKYAEKYLDLQREQFKRIGVFGRFDNPYSTMVPQYESVVLDTFYSFFEKDFIYKGLRSVFWCIHDRTALAEAEVEYENHTSPTVWVKYRLHSDAGKIDPKLAQVGKPIFTIIWTTTPWTLPTSMAVAFHPKDEYVALETEDAIYIVASQLATTVSETCGFVAAKPLAYFPGKTMEYTEFEHPFLRWEERKVLGVIADYVTMDQGTGVVHTAPSHGADDFATGVKYKLPLTSDVDAGGFISEGLPEYKGKKVFAANAPIVELLRERGVLLHSESLQHSYPHCWRCHNPIIFRATEQWFISMETAMEGGGTLRSNTLEAIKGVKWDPAWGEERISNMIETRPDWCISRQRIWGVPIAVFLCDGCGKPLNDHGISTKVVELFARDGADAWYTEKADAIAVGAKCPHCKAEKFTKETDILDVWFESGSSHAAVLGHEENLPWPADLYLEGGDQYRGWFHSSLLCAIGTRGKAPYRMVSTNGWTLDEKGRAMSKSLNNGVDPVDVADRLGAEIVRLWVASVDFREDVACSEQLMQRVADNYRKIRNTFRYILGNLSDFDPAKNAVAFDKLEPLDQYMLRQTAAMRDEALRNYGEFAFHKIYHRVNHFCVVELSAFYFDVLKDRLYTSAPNSAARRAAQTTIWQIGEALVRVLAPITSFTSDEVWQLLPSVEGRKPSVHLELFPAEKTIFGTNPPAEDPVQREAWTALRSVRDEVLKALEEARNSKLIGGGLEAEVIVTAPEPLFSLLTKYADQLRYLFIVSAVALQAGEAVSVRVGKALGQKCERCWNYSTRVGEDPGYPTVCERCSAVLKEITANT
jgi:isoleucyl-tRNA synthetase